MDFQRMDNILGMSDEELYALVADMLGEDVTREEAMEVISALLAELNQGASKTYTLRECLSFLRKDELIGLMKTLGLRGYSKMRKDELIQHLQDALTAPDFMPNVYVALTNNEVEMLEQLCVMNVPMITTEILYAAMELLNYGLCYLDKTESHLVMPEEFKQSFQQATENEALSQKQQHYSAIYDICNAAVYFYGVYPISELLVHLEEDAHISMNEQDLLLWYADSALYREAFYFQNGYIISVVLQHTPEDIMTLKQIQREKKRTFWPSVEQIEELSMEQWVIDEELYEPFWDFAPQLMENPFGDIMSVSRFAETSIRTGVPVNEILKLFTGQLFELESQEQLQAFINVFQNLWNNTPMWENCGYSPKQFGKLLQKNKKTASNKNNVVSLAAHKAKKKKKKRK